MSLAGPNDPASLLDLFDGRRPVARGTDRVGRRDDRLGGDAHCALSTYEGLCVEPEPTLDPTLGPALVRFGEAARSLEPGEPWTTRTGRLA